MQFFVRKNFWIILLSDLILLSLCYYSAYWLRFDGIIGPAVKSQILATIVPLLIIKISSFYFLDLYRGMWRYAGVKDLINIIKASITGSMLFVVYLAVFHHFTGFSRGVLLADVVLTVMLIGGIRLLIRLYYQRDEDFFHEILFWRKANTDTRKVLIIGTDYLAERLLREVRDLQKLNYKVIGFVDENPKNKGMKIHGVPIIGCLEDIPHVARYYEIESILIADVELKPRDIAKIIESCDGLGVHFKVIPSLSERIVNNIADNLRDIKVEDLLERDQISIDMHSVRSELEQQTVLITGAGGSIGSELSRQILAFNPKRLILLDNAETPLYQIDIELRSKDAKAEIIPCIGDIRSRRGLDRIFKMYKPQFVYHAAAYKHVPMMEFSPLDAVNNNIIGTFKLASVASKHHVKKFVLISTDKAVRPTSIMGTTKRIAEMVVQSMNGNGTQFVVVRFGNVLGSNGSVVPFFQKQITSGGPVTVTHPEVTRFFMTIPEAVMLVLQAGSIGRGGELFLLDMGEPVKIVDLAKNMIRLAGLIPDRDIKIDFIGLRPGEKIYEELLIDGEGVLDTAYDKIKVCNNAYGIDEETLYEAIEHFNLLLKNSGDNEAAVAILKRIVPAFKENHYIKKMEFSQGHELREEIKTVSTEDWVH
jgi:FlaA1/EpsC-like NDP-sugar epimerase